LAVDDTPEAVVDRLLRLGVDGGPAVPEDAAG
jgi:hypothetical protein